MGLSLASGGEMMVGMRGGLSEMGWLLRGLL